MGSKDECRIVAHLIARNTFSSVLHKALLAFEENVNLYKALCVIANEWLVSNSLENIFEYFLFDIIDGKTFIFLNLYNNKNFEISVNNTNEFYILYDVMY